MTFRTVFTNALSAAIKKIDALPMFADKFTGSPHFTADGKVIHTEATETEKGSGQYTLSTVSYDVSTIFSLSKAHDIFSHSASMGSEMRTPDITALYGGKTFSKEEAKKLVDETSLDASVNEARRYNAV